MSGKDTSRGINFQYACALSIILDSISRPKWRSIQLEGDEDIEDVVVLGEGGELLLRAQIKQKSDPEQWQPAEFRDVLLAFSECVDTDATQYRFIYSGSEGKAISRIKPVLIKICSEGWRALTDDEAERLDRIFGEEAVAFLSKVGGRLGLDRRESRESIRARDLIRLRRLDSRNGSSQLEEGFEEVIYDKLFREVAGHSEHKIKYLRRLTRQDVLSLVGLRADDLAHAEFDLRKYVEWLSGTARSWMSATPLSLFQSTNGLTAPGFVVSMRDESELTSATPVPLVEAIRKSSQLSLAGDSGSGKTVSLWQMIHWSCRKLLKDGLGDEHVEKIPVFVDLAGYDGESIPALIGQSLEASGQIAHIELIEELSRKGQLLLLMDDFGLARRGLRRDLLLRIRSWSNNHPSCDLVVATHRPSDGQSLGLKTYRLSKLSIEQSRGILLAIPGIEERDATTILNSLTAESRHLVELPLTLMMLAYAYLTYDKRIPKSLGLLYRDVVGGFLSVSESKGYAEFEMSDKLHILGLLAAWMQDNEVYHLSPIQISGLLAEWISAPGRPELAHLDTEDKSQLRSEVLQSGLLRYRPEGSVEVIHPTFQAFLATATVSVQRLEAILERDSWETSLVLWSSLAARQDSDRLLDLLAEKPGLLGRVIRERAQRREERSPQLSTKKYFEEFYSFYVSLYKHFKLISLSPTSEDAAQEEIALKICETSNAGFAFKWCPSQGQGIPVQYTTIEELFNSGAGPSRPIPYPICLLPNDVIERYHPIELAYLWILRSLFDLLVFMGWEGGIDVAQFAGKRETHPAVAMITNRYIAFQEMAARLPENISQRLPFFATAPFHLIIDMSEAEKPPTVRFVVIPSENEDGNQVTQSIWPVGASDRISVFEKDAEGACTARVGNDILSIPSFEEETLGEVMGTSPSQYARDWVYEELRVNFPGFPPEDW